MTRLLEEFFATEATAIDGIAERHAERVERERATLTRPDGSLVYGPQEHQERLAAILEGAGAAYDADVARYASQAERELSEAEGTLARLEGEDGWGRLTDTERQVASTRQAFVKEDAETLPADELARRARAAVAAKDRAAAYLWHRALTRRPRTAPGSVELATAVRDLAELLGLSDQAEKRCEQERRIEATKTLRGRVARARRRVDGSDERMRQQMRRQYANFV